MLHVILTRTSTTPKSTQIYEFPPNPTCESHGTFTCITKVEKSSAWMHLLFSRDRIIQEDVNGEKLTMKKWWIFGADFSRFMQKFSRSIRDINGEKNISLLMIFFTVSFSRFAPSRIIWGAPKTSLGRDIFLVFPSTEFSTGGDFPMLHKILHCSRPGKDLCSGRGLVTQNLVAQPRDPHLLP